MPKLGAGRGKGGGRGGERGGGEGGGDGKGPISTCTRACLRFHGAQLVRNAILRCDPDVRKELWANVVLTGGNTMFRWLPERLQIALDALDTHGTCKPRIDGRKERKTRHEPPSLPASTLSCFAKASRSTHGADEAQLTGDWIFPLLRPPSPSPLPPLASSLPSSRERSSCDRAYS